MIVEVAYALPYEAFLKGFEVNKSTTVKEAIELSGVLQKYPSIKLNECQVGIFSNISKLDDKLRDKDRVEIYRPLLADPKKVRRKRANSNKTLQK